MLDAKSGPNMPNKTPPKCFLKNRCSIKKTKVSKYLDKLAKHGHTDSMNYCCIHNLKENNSWNKIRPPRDKIPFWPKQPLSFLPHLSPNGMAYQFSVYL